jgi:hypothetical protein
MKDASTGGFRKARGESGDGDDGDARAMPLRDKYGLDTDGDGGSMGYCERIASPNNMHRGLGLPQANTD